MIRGEFEGLEALRVVSPGFVPFPYAWGSCESDPETHFLLTEFREIGQQPPEPLKFCARLADLHRRSMSPNGRFGFHVTTYNATLAQVTDLWEASWARLYQKQLAHLISEDNLKNGDWPEFKVVCALVLEKVIPRLLVPLQSEGRTIKPCLVHGDLWDENTATDMRTGEPFVFDPSAMYGM